MAPLQLTVRLSTTDSFPMEIEDDETVEAMAVAIFSLRPELGEELRLAHKGRPLKDDWELRQASVKSGDVIAVARKPQQQPAPKVAVSEATVAPPTAAVEVPVPPVPIAAQVTTDTPAPATIAAVVPTVAVPAVVPMAVPTAVPKQLDAAAVSAPPVEAVPTPKEAQPAPPIQEAQPPPPIQETQPAPPTEEEAQPAPPTQEAPLLLELQPASPTQETPVQEAQPASPSQQASAQEEAAAPGATPEQAEEEEEISAEALLAMAQRLEGGDADAHPSQLVRVAAMLRKAATRLQVVEAALGEVGNAMQLVNMLSVHSLRNLNSLSGARSEAPEGAKEDGHKSYLIKKGDADVQEAHRLASMIRPSTSPSGKACGSGGMLSSSATPLTKEEMDRARNARLERLEAQQAEKRREQEEAAARSKAHESLFEKPFAGSVKPLGKH